MNDSRAIVSELQAIFDRACQELRTDILAYAKDGTTPPQRKREDGSYAYPELRLHFSGEGNPSDRSRAFGRLEQPGVYSTTVTRPSLFADYLEEQIGIITSDM